MGAFYVTEWPRDFKVSGCVESEAGTRLSTVERYAAAVGAKVTWHLEPGRAAETA